jgi:hypothetical protein
VGTAPTNPSCLIDHQLRQQPYSPIHHLSSAVARVALK